MFTKVVLGEIETQETPDKLFDPEKIKAYERNKFPFYILILGSSTDGFLADFMNKYTSTIHAMTGRTCLLFTPYPTINIPEDLNEYYKKNLKADDYRKLLEEGPNPDLSFGVARILNIEFQKLPGIFITTNLNNKDGIFLKIPKWDEEDLMTYFEYVVDNLNSVANLTNDKRLEKLKDMAKHTSWNNFRLNVKNNWFEVVKSDSTKQLLLGFLGVAPALGL